MAAVPNNEFRSGEVPRAARVTMNLPLDELEALQVLAERRQVSITHALRQCIANERFIDDQLLRGARLFVEGSDGDRREVRFESQATA